jgi:hypothetical protein
MFQQHFERVVLKDNSPECIKSMGTAVEDELSALSSFFGNSCRPGEWAGEQYWNKNLSKYLNWLKIPVVP